MTKRKRAKREVKDPDLVLAEQLDHRIRTTAKGAGDNRVNIADVWKPEGEWTPGRRVYDARQGTTLCRWCKAEIRLVQEGRAWVKREASGKVHRC